MPSTHKKTPPTALKKKTTASARAKVNLTKGSKKKQNMNQNDGSYLGESTATGNNHVTIQAEARMPASQLHTEQKDSQILTLLHDLKASNDALTHRLDRLERNFSVNSTPMNSPLPDNNTQGLPCSGYIGPTPWTAPAPESQLGLGRRPEAVVGVTLQGVRGSRPSDHANETHNRDQMSGQVLPVPTMDQIRRDTGISTAVSQCWLSMICRHVLRPYKVRDCKRNRDDITQRTRPRLLLN